MNCKVKITRELKIGSLSKISKKGQKHKLGHQTYTNHNFKNKEILVKDKQNHIQPYVQVQA